jgi:hypothetical protein
MINASWRKQVNGIAVQCGASVTCQMQTLVTCSFKITTFYAPFGVAYDKIGTIQRRLAWPLHKDDTLVQSGMLRHLIFMLIFASTKQSTADTSL